MESLTFRMARPCELEEVCAFYWDLSDRLADAEYSPRWTREVYPARNELAEMIDERSLRLAELDGRLIGGFAVDQASNEDYAGTPWPSGATDAEAAVVHLLCVDPDCQGQGIGTCLIREAVEVARQMGVRVVRLDVLTGNLPAHRLYESVGFVPVITKELFYEDTGRVDFTLYELEL